MMRVPCEGYIDLPRHINHYITLLIGFIFEDLPISALFLAESTRFHPRLSLVLPSDFPFDM
jgi:hypothetical protein